MGHLAIILGIFKSMTLHTSGVFHSTVSLHTLPRRLILDRPCTSNPLSPCVNAGCSLLIPLDFRLPWLYTTFSKVIAIGDAVAATRNPSFSLLVRLNPFLQPCHRSNFESTMELTFVTELGQTFEVEIDENMELENVMALLEAEVSSVPIYMLAFDTVNRCCPCRCSCVL